MVSYKGQYVESWRLVKEMGSKVNTYTVYVTKNARSPVYYEMLGFDSLYGSHYDDYKITFDTYMTEYNDTVFDVPIKGACANSPCFQLCNAL